MRPETDDLAKLRDSLDATRSSVDVLVRQIDRRNRRRVGLVSVALLMLSGFVGVNAWSRHEQNNDDCHRANETRALIRDMTSGASIAAGEALIDVAGADAGQVDRYRRALSERLEDVVSKLPDRDC